MFTLVMHSFTSLIYKELSRKATLMFQDVLLFELLQRTLPNPFLFSFKSTKTISRQNLQVRKKAYYPRTAPGRAIRFLPLSNQSNPYLSCTNECAIKVNGCCAVSCNERTIFQGNDNMMPVSFLNDIYERKFCLVPRFRFLVRSDFVKNLFISTNLKSYFSILLKP